MDLKQLEQAIYDGCIWLGETAQKKESKITNEVNRVGYNYDDWTGAIRTEYNSRTKAWDFFGTVWHTGQAVKALCMYYKLTGEKKFLEFARLGSQFIANSQISEGKNTGFIYAYEDEKGYANVSAILESLDGLLIYAEITGEAKYGQVVEKAVSWIAENAYSGNGLFRNLYSPEKDEWMEFSWSDEYKPKLLHRPLIDDAIFLKVYRLTNDDRYKKIFYEIADRLLEEEYPDGNWVNIGPAQAHKGILHPRHAFWWGKPLIDAYVDSGDERYLECVKRGAQWYKKAQRVDGGFFRDTYADFRTPSFDHATSGTACAAIMWIELQKQTSEQDYCVEIEKSLNYCMQMQFKNTSDKNLQGAVLEKIMMPDGTDLPLFYLRDVGTTFFLQAACMYIDDVRRESI